MIVDGVLASAWNKLIEHVKRNRIRDVVVLQNGRWQHPWTVTPVWDGDLNSWTAQITPGFVNGLDATVSVPLSQAPAATAARLKADNQLPQNSETSVDAWLTEGPQMPLNDWRSIGPDATPSDTSTDDNGNVTLVYEQVPSFFLALGVGASPNVSTDAGTFQQTVTGPLADSGNVRLLRALDLVLFIDRLANATQWTTGAGVDGTFAQFNVTTVAAPNARQRAYINQFSQWVPPEASTQEDLLEGDFTDQTNDQYMLATVYLVSPAGAAFNSNPDGSWTPYVKHSLFWNLNQATNQPAMPLQSDNLTLQTGLAGGVGDAINNYILAQLNDANSAAAQFLSNQIIASMIWSI